MKSKLKSGPCFFDQIPRRWRGEEMQCTLSPFGRPVYVVRDTIEHQMCVEIFRNEMLPWLPSDTCSNQSLLAEFLFFNKDFVYSRSYVPDAMFNAFAKLMAENPTAKMHILTPDDEFDKCPNDDPVKSDPHRLLQSKARGIALQAAAQYAGRIALADI